MLDVAQATNLNRRDLMLDLGSAGGAGPRLILDGSQYANPTRSDSCLAWLIPPQPTKMPKKGQKIPEATHTLGHKDLVVSLASGESLTYQAPILKDLAAAREITGQTGQGLYRERTAFDSEVLEKPASSHSKPVANDGFVFR